MNKILGIVWDYDGTIINSAKKNIEVTIELLKHFDRDIEKHLPKALTSYNNYQEANHKYANWQDLYLNEYGIKYEQLEKAGKIWVPKQRKNKTIPNMFLGMSELLRELKSCNMGICSQNSKETISHTLKYYNIHDCIDTIIGYDDIPVNKQKPNATSFILCDKILNPNNEDGTYIYIGDHSDDIVFGKNFEKKLNKKVICITIDHLKINDENHKNWLIKPEHYVQDAKELRKVLYTIYNDL